VLEAVKDKPYRARLRASLTAPARDASSAAQGRDEETAAQPNQESWVDEGKAASRPGRSHSLSHAL
jgi:hypothetical protein